MSWIHARKGAIHPYLPELSIPENLTSEDEGNKAFPSWRTSELPKWSGNLSFDFKTRYPSPFPGHRWLPAPDGFSPYKTPIATTTYDAAGPGWFSWAVAAQQHASFFRNLEDDRLDLYKNGDWVFWAEQFSIQFVAVWGDTIRNHPLGSDDEKELTIHLPAKLGRRE